MGEEGDLVCFYQGHGPKYANYLKSKNLDNCIGCVKNELNNYCLNKCLVTQEYREKIMEDNYRIWKTWIVNGVEKKVLESA